jgi:6-phosphogluconolactonase/glucosamine-6-phosphate isomerase/deaminase
MFLVSGQEKKALVEKILNGSSAVKEKYPAALVNPSGELIWNIS